MRITMERLAYWVVAEISISAVNLVLLVWVIVSLVSLEWEGFYSAHNPTTLEGGFRLIPVSVNSKNETTDRPSIYSGSSASDDIDDLRLYGMGWSDKIKLRDMLKCLDNKARSGGEYRC